MPFQLFARPMLLSDGQMDKHRENTAVTSLPCTQDTGGENPYFDTKGVLKLLNCGRLGRQAAGHRWSALRVVKSCQKTA